jgi:hypothetical protein
MACTLGRAVLPSPDSIRQEGGGKLRIGHSGYPFAGDEGLVMAQQLLGYPNPDEEVVFFTYDATAANQMLDGAYFVVSTDVDWVKLAAGLFSWSAELVPVPAMQLPTFEVSCWGADRVFDAPDPFPDSWVGFPGSAISRTIEKPSQGTAALVGGGTVDVFWHPSDFYDVSVSYAIEAEDVYEAAAQLTVEGSVVTGRQASRTTLGWVVSNGIVRVRPSLTEVNHFVVGIADSTGATYQEYQYRLGYYDTEPFEYGYDGTTRHAPVGVVVLRNSPEAVIVRVVYADTSASQFDAGGSEDASAATLDITLRRGQTYAEFDWTLDNGSSTVEMGVWRSVADPAVLVTDMGGIEDTTAVGGIKWQIFSPLECSLDGPNGGLRVNAGVTPGDKFSFGIGNDRDILGGGEPMVEYYFAAQEHHQQIASR